MGLEERGLGYVVAVKADTSVYPGDVELVTAAYSGRGPRPKPSYPIPPMSLRELALAAGRDTFSQVCWRQGTRKTAGNPAADMASKFALVQVRPANRNNTRAEDGSLRLKLALVEWPDNTDEPTDYWLTNLPTDTPIEHIVDLAKIRWRIEHDYRELKTGLGLDHFEGRTWTGWNRHVTLAALAQAFVTMLRLDPKAPAPA
ncbi:SRSO17 transposase [Actinopolymorpha pittospori]|uniref:SRSO17 transposase n=1 Tax=Actinopolymorpha pittospori TaxID=648752 RepID=A0A927MRL8_9ACTN|nr:SRSO17 transposase [Actinopolymorpha pittospori]